ncbi:hypothetical protein LTR37_002247 [Vermiconidia calcicola]|uniref:Uncharacterized protein n=1 Tax=Vermiconidia calcicola TaxID=1690605 RepID=A0ACC3NVW7_9PEZI|nr:hypothetical protein LTR37_002247 [Vermiconidia calcicola]
MFSSLFHVPLFLVLSTQLSDVVSEPSFTPILPPSYPLAVRNTYLSAWLPGNQTENIAYAVPEFWNGQPLTWSVMARVDGESYSLFGVPEPESGVKPGLLQSADYTSTHTTFVVTAGLARFVLDFLSPISPQDYVRQSLPLSYLTVSASGINGAAPSIQVYSDIDNSWAGQFGENVATSWGYALSRESTHIFTLTPGGTATFSEVDDMAQWGTAVYCTRPGSSSQVSGRVGGMGTVRSGFVSNGNLTGDWGCGLGSVIAFSHDLGSCGSPKNVSFAVGYVRDAAVNYLGNPRASYWQSAVPDISAACVHAFLDFPRADLEARNLDAAIASRASSTAGDKYRDIVTLSVRQVFGAFDVTIPKDTLNTSDVMVFVKEISSNGNVNTVDVIMPISPILYVMAPEYIRLLLEPVIQYLASGAWPHNYTIHDIGTHFPNATGHNDGTAEEMPAEECGNILLLASMYQLASGNTDWWKQHSSLFQLYADYLVTNGLYPKAQLSSDDGAGPIANETGLAIKAAIALNAFGIMTNQSSYSDTGRRFADTLYKDAVGTDAGRTHFTLTLNDAESWGTQYNLFLDVLLNLTTFPTEAYTMETSFYPTDRATNGVALDSRVDWAKTDWMHWAAGTAMAPGVENEDVRDMFVNDVHAFLTNGQNTAPFSDNFFIMTNGSDVAGVYNTYRARPVAGGHFALMALNGPARIEIGAGESEKSSTKSEGWVERLLARFARRYS